MYSPSPPDAMDTTMASSPPPAAPTRIVVETDCDVVVLESSHPRPERCIPKVLTDLTGSEPSDQPYVQVCLERSMLQSEVFLAFSGPPLPAAPDETFLIRLARTSAGEDDVTAEGVRLEGDLCWHPERGFGHKLLCLPGAQSQQQQQQQQQQRKKKEKEKSS